MRSVRHASLGVLLGAALFHGCGTTGQAPLSPPPVTVEVKTVEWRIDVGTSAESGFGLRLFVNGQQVHVVEGTARSYHRVDVVTPYVPGLNVIEADIGPRSDGAATYALSCTAKVKPSGGIVHADGFPRTVPIGERLLLAFEL